MWKSWKKCYGDKPYKKISIDAPKAYFCVYIQKVAKTTMIPHFMKSIRIFQNPILVYIYIYIGKKAPIYLVMNIALTIFIYIWEKVIKLLHMHNNPIIWLWELHYEYIIF